MIISSFPPIESPDCKILILGSMPGAESLRLRQYYAHKQNAFWFIMGELFGASFDVVYIERIEMLKANNIAVWDSLKYCQREGSLDSAIHDEYPNDLEGFVLNHKNLKRIIFNGKKSEQVFRKFILKPSPAVFDDIEIVSMPSTSPAMATLTKQQKLELWQNNICVNRT